MKFQMMQVLALALLHAAAGATEKDTSKLMVHVSPWRVLSSWHGDEFVGKEPRSSTGTPRHPPSREPKNVKNEGSYLLFHYYFTGTKSKLLSFDIMSKWFEVEIPSVEEVMLILEVPDQRWHCCRPIGPNTIILSPVPSTTLFVHTDSSFALQGGRI